MVSPKSRETVPCDFCNEQIAILYCRADSAKLCLLCDQHVHSANALSKKHLRSQICDNCGSEPVSVRCSTDNLLLCQDCDWDAHGNCSVSATHDRNPVDGFSGCPSALELASAWGLEIEDKKPNLLPSASLGPNWGSGLLNSWMNGGGSDLIVPNHYNLDGVNYSNCGGESMMKKQSQSPNCGKQKQMIMKQLVSLLEKDLVDGGGGGGEDLGPDTPNGSGGGGGGVLHGNEEAGVCELGDGGGEGVFGIVNQQFQQHQQQQNAPFMSLLMMQTPATNRKENDRMVEGNMLWNSNPCDQGPQATQIWDFNLGQLRDHDELDGLEYSGGDVGYMMKSYGELLKEVSLPRGVEITGLNCSIVHEDMVGFNNSNNPSGSQGLATSGSNNLPAGRPASGSGINGKRKCYGVLKDYQLMDQSVLVKSENTSTVITNADMELLAKNRGNAMQRYKEKKKTRRYDKQIRYESRKARADTRKRVNGRFVKANDAPDG